MDSSEDTARLRREKFASEQPPRKRARQSCDACKARKTKCISFDNGPCQYCQTLRIPCEVNLKNRKRPFYKVSEEVYDYSIKLLRQFVPEDELPELTVEGIRGILQRLKNGSTPHLQLDTTDGGATKRNQEIMEPDEHPILKEELGCMVLDSMGKYRYVGADSSMRWNHAARMTKDTVGLQDPKIILPLKTGLLPPTTPESPGVYSHREIYLPCRELCMYYVGRFFAQIHSMYWFYSPEHFYTLLDQTLEKEVTASSSWLCSLYSIFALGSMEPGDGPREQAKDIPRDGKQASDYLTLAKALSPTAADEADVESVKAFGLLSLATHAMCYSITAYLYLGTAVRIGFSLGLHRDVFPRTRTSVERERGRRLWWTIYVLDHEMASRFGYPCAITDDASFMKARPASEQILDPGPNMPLGYQELAVSLVRVRKRISHDCFLEPAYVGGRLPISRVTKCLNALSNWLESAPPHLQWDSSLPPPHRRSAAVLHLRYWTSVISVTRPFLLFTVARSVAMRCPTKRKCYEELSSTCIDAAERSVQILRRMREHQTLSSMTLHDCHCTGEVMWILILALQKRATTDHQEMLRFCLDTLSSMERIGWCEKVLPDLEARVHESGVLETEPGAQLDPALQLLQEIPRIDPSLMRDGGTDNILAESSFGVDYADIDFDACQFDVFETLDLDTRTGLMDIFSEANLAMSHPFPDM